MIKKYFFLFLLFFCASCNQSPELLSHPAKQTDPVNNFNNHPYHPLIRDMLLWDDQLQQTITITSTYSVVGDTATPAEILERVTILNDSARHVGVKTSWHVLKLVNFSSYNKWVLSVNNTLLLPKLFIRKVRNEFDIHEIIGEKRYTAYYAEPVTELFDFQIQQGEEIYLLLQVTSIEPVYILELKLYTYTHSKYQPVSVPGNIALERVILLLMAIVMLVFLFYSKDLGYLIFIIQIIPWLFGNLSPVGSNAVLVWQLLGIIRFCCYMLLVLFISFEMSRWNWKLTGMAVLLCLKIFITFINLNYLLRTGVDFSAVVDLLADVFLLFCCYRGGSQKINRFSLIMLLSIIGLHIFSAGDNLFNLAPGISVAAICAPLILIAFFVALLFRFKMYLRNKRKMDLERQLASQKLVSGAVIRSLEEERRRISQDLHDEIGGTLALVKIKLHAAVDDQQKLADLQNIVSRAAASARTIAYELMPPYFADTDFKMLLFAHFNSLNEKGLMHFDFTYAAGEYTFSKDDELMIYRIVLELAHNCLKHSAANTVRVKLDYQPTQLLIICEDDGKGMPANVHTGIGMQSVESRILFMDGTMQIKSDQAGTNITIHIPYSKRTFNKPALTAD